MAVKALLLLSLLVGLALAKQDPELKQCQHQCRHQRQFDEQQKEECERSCEEYIREKKQREREREGDGIEEKEEDQNPYLFEDKDFEARVKTEEGRVRVLEKFSKRSKLLRGIENYRVAILEANPHTFIAPAHFDAELVLFVAKGT